MENCFLKEIKRSFEKLGREFFPSPHTRRQVSANDETGGGSDRAGRLDGQSLRWYLGWAYCEGMYVSDKTMKWIRSGIYIYNGVNEGSFQSEWSMQTQARYWAIAAPTSVIQSILFQSILFSSA